MAFFFASGMLFRFGKYLSDGSGWRILGKLGYAVKGVDYRRYSFIFFLIEGYWIFLDNIWKVKNRLFRITNKNRF